MPSVRRPLAVAVVLAALSSTPAQPPAPPDQQAELLLTAAKKAFNDGNRDAAGQQFRTLVEKFGTTPQAQHARYGLALLMLSAPDADLAKVIEAVDKPAADGNFPDRGGALHLLAVCHRVLGLKELDKPAANPAEAEQRKKAAEPRFADAAKFFRQAMDWHGGRGDADRSARARCDEAEMQLRLGKVKEARGLCEPLATQDAFAKNPHRPLGLYYHGFACFLDRDYANAGRSLNQLAPFDQPGYGPHARYLVGRVLQLAGEGAEASVHYDGVLAGYDKQKKEAAERLKQPDQLKADPLEKARLEAVASGPAPDYVAGAAFHGATLNYEAGKFADALGKFQAFAKDYPASPLAPDAALRAGFCLVQLKQFDEAAKLLAPLAQAAPRLADQALFWLGKAQLGIARGADPANPADRDNKLKAAVETLQKAAEAAKGLEATDPDAKLRRQEVLLELADALQAAGRFKDAVPVVEALWNEQALPARRDEVLQRLACAAGAAGEMDKSDQRCDEFRQAFPDSLLTPAVLLRQADNAYARAVALGADPAKAEERKQKLTDAAGRFKDVAAKYPEFDRVNHARLGHGVCLAHLGDLDAAVTALEAIPAPDRNGELAVAGYLLADCLIRQAPAKADDALAENMMREKLTAAAALLDAFAAANPKAAAAPAALLKLGHCLTRLGASLADPNERNQTLNRGRETFDKLQKDYPQSPLAGQGRLEAARVKSLMGDKGGAMNDLRSFAGGPLDQSPVAPLAAIHLAVLLREQNNPADAAKVLEAARQKYEAALAQDKERADWGHLLRYHHAVALAETEKYADARPLFDRVYAEAKGRPIQADAALRAGQCRVAEAKKLLQQGAKLRSEAGKDGGKIAAADQTTQKGRAGVYEAANEMAARNAQLKAAFADSEARARLLYDAAWANREQAGFEVPVAREQVQKQLAVKRGLELAKKLPPNAPLPELPPPDVRPADVPLQPGEQRAMTFYRSLIEEYPTLSLAVDARLELAELLADRDDHPGAVKLLKDALDAEPTDKPTPPDLTDRVRLRLGSCLFAAKDYAAAAAQFDAVAADPKRPYHAEALFRAGESLYAAGEYGPAADRLAPFRDRKELQQVGGVSDRAVVRLGQALVAAKQWEAARQAFEAALGRYKDGPLAAEARYGVGAALQGEGRYDDAAAAFAQVTAATTAEVAARAQLQIGRCRLAQKKYADAAAALLLVPYAYDAPEAGYAALLEAARAFADDAKPADAVRVLRRLLQDAPADSDWARAAKERLGQLDR